MTISVLLTRFAYSPYGTFGKLLLPEFECYTVERPWLDNKPRQSCIPEGNYAMQLGRYNRGGYDVYEVIEVPGRSLIKIHIGNTMEDVIGCIAVGNALGYIEGKWAVTSSKKAFGQFMQAMQGQQSSELRIEQYHP